MHRSSFQAPRGHTPRVQTDGGLKGGLFTRYQRVDFQLVLTSRTDLRSPRSLRYSPLRPGPDPVGLHPLSCLVEQAARDEHVVVKAWPYCGSISRLGHLIATLAPARLLLVTGRSSFDKSGAATHITPITRRITETRRWVITDRLPMRERVDEGTELIREFQPGMIIAVGGGTVMDVAKAARYLAIRHDGSRERQRYGRRFPRLVAIPTTAGTGSEVTHFAVVYEGSDKVSLADPSIRPDYSILDPKLATSAPAHVRAAGALDGLTQSMESHWSVGSTDRSMKYSRAAMALLARHLVDGVQGNSPEAQCAVSVAAHLSGRAIDITKTTMAHALSYHLTYHFDVPHGYAVGLTAGQCLDFNQMVGERDCRDPRGPDSVRNRINEVRAVLGIPNEQSGAEYFGAVLRALDLDTDLQAIGLIDTSAIRRWVSEVNTDRLANNPRAISAPQLEEFLFRRISDGVIRGRPDRTSD